MGDSIPPIAMLVQSNAMGISHVGYAWSHIRFDAATPAAVRSATSLVCLASRTAFGLAHIAAHADYHVRYLVIYFHVLNAAR